MKILLINNCHWPRGGSEVVYYNTATLLKEAGHKVVFFSFEDENNILTGDLEYLIKKDVGFKKIKSYFNNEKAAQALDTILTKENPDIAHAHLMWGGMTAAIIPVLHKHGIPLVHTAHDYRMVCPAYLLKDGKGRFCERCKCGRFINCFLYRCSKGNLIQSALMSIEMYYRNRKWHPAKAIDGLIFVSNFSKNKHLEFDSSFAETKSMVLYNCPGQIVSESLDLSKDTCNSYYLFYGRLAEEKGIHTLLKAWDKFPVLKLKVVGTGVLEDTLKKYCAERELKNVEFLGYKTGKELYDLVAGAKYVCVPSECYENNPMTIVEAYSLGIPVIGAAIGGISEIVNNGKTGFLFESGNVKSLEEALLQSMNIGKEEYSTMKNNALCFSQENFGRKRYVERLVMFYKDVIRR